MSADLTPQEAAALDALDEAALAQLLLELVAIPNVSGSPAESEIQHVLAS